MFVHRSVFLGFCSPCTNYLNIQIYCQEVYTGRENNHVVMLSADVVYSFYLNTVQLT